MDNSLQNPSELEITPDMEAQAAAQQVLNEQQQTLVDYHALSGIVMDGGLDEHGNLKMRKMPYRELAEMIGVHPTTLYAWQNSIPAFWQRVNDRRKQLSQGSRLAKVHEVWYLSSLKAGAAGFRDRQLWLANFDKDFRMPTEKVEHEVGNSWAAMFERKRKQIDSKVIDADTPNPST